MKTTELPEEWELRSLSDVSTIIMGQSPPSSTYNSSRNGLPFFQGKAEFGEIYPTVEKWCSEPGKVAEPNDILLSVRAPVGPTNLANVKCCIGRGLSAIRYNFPDAYKYLYFYFKCIEPNLSKQGTGSTFKAISKKHVETLPFPLPPLPEQKRIVAKIEELFSDLDKAVESLKKAQAQLKTYRQAVLKYAFEGRFTHSSCQTKTIQEVCQIIDGDRGPNYPKKSDFTNKGYCLFLNTSNVRNNGFNFDECQFISKEKHEKLRKGTVERGDVVFTSRGTLGNSIFLEDWVRFKIIRINSGMLILRPQNELITGKFLQHYLRSPQITTQIRKMSSGTAQPQLPIREFKDFTISFPSTKVQEEIVLWIEQMLSKADYMEKTINQSLEKADATRQSILKKAFEGRLV